MTRQLDWFAVSVEPRRKSAVARSLRSIGLEEFVPIYSQRRRLFLGYVFCRFDYQKTEAVLGTPGGLSIVGLDESEPPVVVGVEALRRAVAVEINREMVRAVEGAPHAQMARLYMTA